MIVSIDTIKCGRQILSFFGQDAIVVVETCEILSFIFLKRGCYCWRHILKLVCIINVWSYTEIFPLHPTRTLFRKVSRGPIVAHNALFKFKQRTFRNFGGCGRNNRGLMRSFFAASFLFQSQATLDSSMTMTWFSWTNHYSPLRITTNEFAPFRIDNWLHWSTRERSTMH